jgi:ATP-dependent exoDNAse (exonuclease V) beta subunit
MADIYDEINHEYYRNGKKLPSVTEICEPISFERLDALQKAMVERAKQRGSRCHELAEEYLLVSELDIDEIESEYIPYMQQFVLWAKTYKPKVLYTEKKLFSDLFAGTLDLICEIDGKTIIVDYKFTSAIDKKSLSVQLDGYDRLAKINGIAVDESWFLHVKKDGYVFKPITKDSEWFDILLKHNQKMKEKYNGK